jgi:glycerophosphoryl diester phosphodiesterase
MNRRFSRVMLAVATVLIAMLGFASAAYAVPDRPASPPPTNYWQDKGFILMAHQGGEWDFPPNTLFAYKSAIANGADMIDMDAYVTQDGKLVLSHDLDARKNSNLTDSDFGGAHDINDLTLEQLKTLDFAYQWSPHDGSSTNPWRGVATGDRQPPAGFTANDFKIPTFAEVLDAFPNTPINIELKQVSGVSIQDTVNAMAAVLAAHPGHNENVIINSFGQEMLEAMHAARPEHLSYSGSLNGSVAYVSGSPITPTPVAIEPPDLYQLGPASTPPTRTVPLLKPFADYDGYKIFVWGSDLDPNQDTDAFYGQLIAEGADSYNTPSPLTLAPYLCSAGIARPDGSPRCPGQVCPTGQTGIAPNNCVDIPPVICPEGQTGTPPNCVTPPAGVASIFILEAVRRYGGKADQSARSVAYDVKVKNKGTIAATGVRACIKVPKGEAKYFLSSNCSNPTPVGAGKTKKLAVKIKSTKKAKGKLKLKIKVTSTNGGSASKTVNPVFKCKDVAGENPFYDGKSLRKSGKKKGSSGQLCGETSHL